MSYTILVSKNGAIPDADKANIKKAIGVQLESNNYQLKKNSTQYKDSHGSQVTISYSVTKIDDKEKKIYVTLK